MAQRSLAPPAAPASQWLRRLQVQLRTVHAELQQMDRLPLLRLAAAVLVALLALAAASGLIAPTQ